MSKKLNFTTKDVCYMALYGAMFVVLDYISHFLPSMPNGGSYGLGTIPLLIASYHLGWQKGVFVGVLSVLLQFITGNMYILGIQGLLFDYVVPFGIYGIACLFPNYSYVYTGVIITNLIRFISHVYTGVVLWELDVVGSIVYNINYMLPTLIIGAVCVPLLMKALKPVLK